MFKLFGKYFRRYKWWMIGGASAMLVTDIVALLLPWLIKNSIDIINAKVDASYLFYLAMAIISTGIILAALRFLWRRIMHDYSRLVELDIRNEFFSHLQRLSPSFYDNSQTGDLMNRATSDIEHVRMFMAAGLSIGSDTAIIMITSLPLMFYINWVLTLYILIPMPFLMLFAKYGSRAIKTRYISYQEKHSDLTARVQENISGMRVVKAYSQEEKENKDFAKYNEDLVDRGMHLVRILGIFEPVLLGALGIGDFIILLFGGAMVMEGSLSLGDFFFFIWLFHWVGGPMIAMGWIMTIYSQARGSMERLQEIFDSKPQITDAPDADNDAIIKGEIEFRSVSLRYSPDTPDVLKNINLKIPQGKTVAIVGPTGCGKTSLINLIPRLYDATEGQVLVDGVDVKKLPLKTLRAAIGYAPQDVLLFSDTLEGNIAFGLHRDFNITEVENAADISQIAANIAEFPNRYKTIVGERGVTLSGGQKQRATISRAVITDPEILILDDSLSSVDVHTEEAILQRLRDVMKGRTSLLISHRVSTIKDADFIVVLSDGEIKERGTHEELIAIDGLYKMMYEKQSLSSELGIS